MIYIILTLAIIAAGAVLYSRNITRKHQAQKQRTKNLEQANATLQDTIKQRDHIIRAMEEVNRETAKKKSDIRTGNDTDNFNASLDVLHDLSRDRDPSAGKD